MSAPLGQKDLFSPQRRRGAERTRDAGAVIIESASSSLRGAAEAAESTELTPFALSRSVDSLIANGNSPWRRRGAERTRDAGVVNIESASSSFRGAAEAAESTELTPFALSRSVDSLIANGNSPQRRRYTWKCGSMAATYMAAVAKVLAPLSLSSPVLPRLPGELPSELTYLATAVSVAYVPSASSAAYPQEDAAHTGPRRHPFVFLGDSASLR